MLKKLFAIFAMLYAAMAFAAVDVNKATAAELDGIKGIGPAISAKILDERKKGNFKDWDDLVKRVNGIGDTNAAKFSAEGLTVGGSAYKGAVAAPAKKDDKPAAKDAKESKPAAKAEEKKGDAKPVAAATPAAAPAAKAEEKKDPKAEAKMKADEEKKAKADAKAKAAEEKKMKAEEEKKAKKDAKPEAKADAAKPAASAAKK